MNFRRALTVLSLAALVAGGVACSSDKDGSANKKDKDKTETTDKKKSDSDGSDETTPPSTVSDDEFSKTMGKLQSDIKAAGADQCALIEAINTSPPQPANKAQTKEFVDTYVVLMTTISDSLGADTDNGKALRDAADKFQAVAKEQDYSEKLLDSDELGKVMTAPNVTEALTEFQTASMKCFSNGEGDGTGAGVENTPPTPADGDNATNPQDAPAG